MWGVCMLACCGKDASCSVDAEAVAAVDGA